MKNEDMEKLARAAAYQDGQIAERDTHIAELKAALKPEWGVAQMKIVELQSRLHLIIDLGFDYDGFESADDLKTLIDDMVKIANGTFEIDEKQAIRWKCNNDTRIAELESERARLREFVEYVLGVYAWDCVDPLHEPDGGSLQDKAEKLKLIEKRPAPQSYRDEWGEDEWYQCVWKPKEADVPKRGKNPDLPSFEDVRGIFPKEADDVGE